MDSYVISTGQTTRGGGSNHASSSRAAGKAPAVTLTRGGGSSHASSSRAAGKAPAVPRKRVKGSSNRKQKRCKTADREIDPESLTYIESESEPGSPPLSPAPAAGPEPKPIRLHGETYRRVEDLAGYRKGKNRSSHIWDKSKGFAMIHEATGAKYYYCCRCLDEKKDPTYKPLSKAT